MKVAVFILLIAFSSIECFPKRKAVPINKSANVDFINMEGGGGYRPAPASVPAPAPAKPASPPQSPQPKTPTEPVKPVITTAKPVPVLPVPTQPPKPAPQQPKPNHGLPTQMDLKTVQPGKPGGSPVTTPGPGNVKQLVTFYDSQGKASVIRPYSYSEAVKKGKK